MFCAKLQRPYCQKKNLNNKIRKFLLEITKARQKNLKKSIKFLDFLNKRHTNFANMSDLFMDYYEKIVYNGIAWSDIFVVLLYPKKGTDDGEFD